MITGLPERFRIEEEIGSGGMAVVFRAYDTKLARPVAIKVLSEAFSNAVGTERFEREIAVMAKLVHPGIVSLFDSGSADGRLYYVMPLVPGHSLRAHLSRARRLSPDEATSITADIAEALAFAHRAGVVHRDVKPENVFLVGGRALLADFGIAHVCEDASERSTGEGLTTAGVIVGTLAYMSPEQASGRPVDGRSDLYSLGCVLYEMLTGAPPFNGTAVAIIGQHLTAIPKSLTSHDIRVPSAVNDLVSALLSKDPDRRSKDADEVVRMLRTASQSDSGTRANPAASEVDRLVAEGAKSVRLGGAGGPTARAHLEQAQVYLKRALAIEPNHARALCLCGNVYFIMARYGYTPHAEAVVRGRELIMSALAADDQIAEVHSTLSKLALYTDADCHAAERHIQRAVTLDPRDAEVRRIQCIILKILGRPEEAVAAAQAAVELAPDIPAALNALGDALLAAGRTEDALDVLRKAIRLQPGHLHSLERMELALVRLGDFEAACDYRSSRLRQSGQAERADAIQRDSDRLGPEQARRSDLEREVEQLLERAASEDPFADTYAIDCLGDRIALTYAHLGDWPNAVSWIERAHAHTPGRLRRLLMDLPFDLKGLATEPRFRRLLRVAGLEDLDSSR
jgi:tetratricopeptide (TPR) repeat protein